MSQKQPEVQQASMLVTVAVLTFNGDTYLEEILSAVERQAIDGDVDILVIDSGSTDRTLEIVARHPRVRLHEIPNSEFGHGRTRNLAARLAHGEFIAFLTHDAIPSSTWWLRELLAPMRHTGAEVKAVMGKQIPRPGCFPLLKYEIRGVFAGFGPDFGTTIFFDDGSPSNQGLLDALSFYSDVNSATLTSFLRNVIPYRDVRYSEDMLFGQDLIQAGYKKAYAPRGAVIHSNDLSLDEYGMRMFDETVALRQIGKPIPPMRRRAQLRMTVRGIVADSIRIMRDPDFRTLERLGWIARNPLYHRAKWRAYRAATMVDLTNDEAIRAGSLEHRRSAGSPPR
ncbi:glycosyltransferase family 2 protein [Agreia sp. COWG]|uniref:glycosyltransferase family 2 protein n=1 Tax=Agreia sp. COWG TaxID=2773266 RepID=UPI001AF5907F|nr:glycosyltransferase family 2 protein [Agreia sp. COWG]CAD5993255.1 Rhamnosyl transferase [Agreia sp. COWG]